MTQDPRSEARDWAIRFMYQSEVEKLFHYSDSHFRDFTTNFQTPPAVAGLTREMVSGALGRLPEVDRIIEAISANWRLSRMPVIDRCILRLATWELTGTETPRKVVINEAIELAKKYGSNDTARFVNGLLDRVGNAPTGT